MGSTLEAAYTLSETLIQEAFEHVQRFFKNSTNWELRLSIPQNSPAPEMKS